MEKRPRGVLDQVKRSEICAILAVGCSRTVAARYVGCHPVTIRNTAQRDEEFARALEQAESKHEILHLTHINKAAKEGRYWRAAAWALERKYPDRYAHRQADMISVEQMSQVLAQFTDVILEEIADEPCRRQVLSRLSELTTTLHASAAEGARA
jgi:hypothetical protein